MTTLDEFIAEHDLTAEVARAADNPNMADDGHPMRHWLVTIRRPAGGHGPDRMHVPFSQGMGHDSPPDLADVLDCLASDASTVERTESFDEWAQDLGFFPMDSANEFRRAQATYEAIERQAAELRGLVGNDALQTLLYDVERI